MKIRLHLNSFVTSRQLFIVWLFAGVKTLTHNIYVTKNDKSYSYFIANSKILIKHSDWIYSVNCLWKVFVISTRPWKKIFFFSRTQLNILTITDLSNCRTDKEQPLWITFQNKSTAFLYVNNYKNKDTHGTYLLNCSVYL